MIYIKIEIIFFLLIQNSNIGSACPDGMKLFLDEEGLLECFSCRKCPVGATKVGNCSHEHDTICDQCTDSEFYDDRSLHCKTCTVCNAGHFIKRNCSKFKDTKCDVCPSGTFSLIQNSSSCTNCTDCRGTQILTQHCQRTADTVCEQIDEENEKLKFVSIVLLGVSIVVFLWLLSFSVIHALRLRRNERHCVTKEWQSLLDSAHEQETTGNADNSLQEFKQNLKDVYRSMLSNNIDVIFGEPYAEFNFTCKNSGNPQQRTVNHIKEVFDGNGEAFKRICVIGDASIGKTTLCRRLVHNFCNSDDQQNHLFGLGKEFDWLFFISLRNFCSKSNVLEMIKCRYFKNENTLWSKILKKCEKILVVLDGFDEWNTRKGNAQRTDVSLDFSNFDDLQNCTVLITTTQLARTQLKSSETLLGIDREIYMKNITRTASANFKRAVVEHLKQGGNGDIVQPYIDDARITTHPVLLKQLVRLLCKNKIRKHPDEPLCTTFGKIVLNWLKDEEILDEKENRRKQLLPECLKTEMQSHTLILSSLGRVSFESLIEHGSNIFDLNALRDAGFTDLMRDLCMRIGLLSQGLDSCIDLEESFEPEERNLISFPHRLYLDYFAAVYLFMNRESVDTFLTKCKTTAEIMNLRGVIMFLSGMESSAMKTIFRIMIEILENDSNLENRLNIQSLLMDCVEQQTTSGNFHLQSIYICSDAFDEKRTLNTNVFFKALQKCKELRSATLDFFERMDNILEEQLLKTLTMKTINLTTLILKGNGCKPYFVYLRSGKELKLMHLQISQIELNHAEKQILMNGVAKVHTVQELVLIDIICNDHEQCPCPLELFNCSKLKTLTLKRVQLGWLRVNTSSLEDCTETDIPVFYSPAKRKFKSSTELKLRHMISPCDVDAFRNLLPNLFRLSYLEVSLSDFGNNDVRLPSKPFSLKNIVLERVNMANDKLIQFINSIPKDAHEFVCEFHNITDIHSEKDISERFEVISYEECVPHGKNIKFKAKPKRSILKKFKSC